MPAVAAPRLFWPAAVMLGIAVVLGGGGAPAPLPEAAVELACLLALGVAVTLGLRPVAVLRADPRWGVLLGLILVFPLCQLVPPALAGALPGHPPQTAALVAIGRAAAWRPWSLAPDGGVAAALALLPALALAVLTAALPAADRVRLMAMLVLLGLVAAVLGVVQFGRGPERPLSFYADVHRGFGIGFFANRNAAADLLAIALVAAVLLVGRWRGRLADRAAATGAGVGLALLAAGAVATGSRMGLAVTLVTVMLALALVPPRWRVGAGAGALLLAGLVVAGGSALDRVAGRASDDAGRADIWVNSMPVARAVWPVEGGMGGFAPLFAAAEPLDAVQPAAVNRAHADYLELLIEGGVPALLLLAATLALVGRRSWRGAFAGDPDRRLLARFAGLSALVLALHALVDYPLRTQTLLTVAGMILGLLAFPPATPHNRAGEQWGRL